MLVGVGARRETDVGAIISASADTVKLNRQIAVGALDGIRITEAVAGAV